jgi:hypothetical protein
VGIKAARILKEKENALETQPNNDDGELLHHGFRNQLIFQT